MTKSYLKADENAWYYCVLELPKTQKGYQLNIRPGLHGYVLSLGSCLGGFSKKKISKIQKFTGFLNYKTPMTDQRS